MPDTKKFLFAFVVMLSASTRAIGGDAETIQFDLPPVVAAVPAADAPQDPSLVTIELRLSSMIVTPTVPDIDQWLVRCQPRGGEIAIADFSPRTETASDVSSPIQVKRVEEKSSSLGMSVDGAYGHFTRGNIGADQGNKNVNSVEFHRQAAVQAVTAAGTINRGRGVYFKLRWTSQQVLEGEKVFSITMAVPAQWRGGLMDVSVIAQTDRKKFGGFDHEIITLGSANFVVATYRAGDDVAASRAARIADAEFMLRRTAKELTTPPAPRSLPSMLRHVAMKLDLEPSKPDTRWLHRLLTGAADPYLDKQITKLPMPVRVAALDYVESREDFAALNRDLGNGLDADYVTVAKPALHP
ncbi:hypothetical protein Poly51_32710 [Rubripirellula tenax]|uniref:Uncharacterized protein n=1 Tax=Rubripirellula tenax TaxID=2528015 RepID=A0A5C6EZU0_9BACT|nr:hypothetical protein [Rubripirellula tenax]TWU54552.1 hypothetical protein Poly51_32710 [Rubripirellula tenax]